MSKKRTPHIRKRDRQGWRVPMEGSLSRRIYDLLVDNWSPQEVARVLKVDVNKVRVLAHRFRHPDWAKKDRA